MSRKQKGAAWVDATQAADGRTLSSPSENSHARGLMNSDPRAENTLLTEVDAMRASISSCLATRQCVASCPLSLQMEVLRAKVIELLVARGLGFRARGISQGEGEPALDGEPYWRLG